MHKLSASYKRLVVQQQRLCLALTLTMPPIRTNVCSKAKLLEREFSGEFKSNGKDELYCLLCFSNVNCDKRQIVERHRATKKHKAAVDAQKQTVTSQQDKTKKVTLIQSALPVVTKEFRAKLVSAFLAADIPLHKLRNPHIVKLFTDLGQQMPSESACRQYVQTLAEKEQDRVKELLKDKSVFIVIDESEVGKQKYINVLAGDIEVPEKTYLVECCVTETANQTIICTKIDDSLRKLKVKRENFSLLLSDAASYMTACTATLKVLYPNLFHVTCLAHMLHNCAEKVRGVFSNVDSLVARVKASTVKNKFRREQFNGIGSPPEPVVTRWGTWLKAADYYAANFNEVKRIVNDFEGDGIIVKRAKEAVNQDGLAASLMNIKRDYSQLPNIIKKMESSKFSISEAHAAISGKFCTRKGLHILAINMHVVHVHLLFQISTSKMTAPASLPTSRRGWRRTLMLEPS